MKLEIKRATERDIYLVFEMNKKQLFEYDKYHYFNLQEALKWLVNKLNKQITEYNCVYLNGEFVAVYHFYETQGKFELDDLYVLDAFQNQGIGSMIIQNCIKQAKENNKTIFLYVFAKNTKAIELYEKHGFVISEAIDDLRYIMEYRV